MQNLAPEKVLCREPLLTTAAVARWLGISTRAVCLWAECKVLPAIKVGRQWRFRKDELNEWLLHSKPGPKMPAGEPAARDYEFSDRSRPERLKTHVAGAR